MKILPKVGEKGATLKLIKLCSLIVTISILGCSPAVESKRTLEPAQIADRSAAGVTRVPVAVGSFINRSTYMNGIFADSNDRLGQQAYHILLTHLSSSPAFTVVDRQNMEQLAREGALIGNQAAPQGAKYILTGAVTEFGRKETGTRTLGGLLSRSKTQTLFANVAISVVEVGSSRVVGSYQGAGEYSLTNSEILGSGSVAGFDSTLADKVLNLAVIEAVQRMIAGRSQGQW